MAIEELDQPLQFAPVEKPVSSEVYHLKWKVVLVDDDPSILLVSQLTLKGIKVNGRNVQILTANSGEAARVLLSKEKDIALVITDAVMETPESGAELLKWIRQQPDMSATRLVMRTGQPGFAPEQQVIEDLDIQDYWSKTDMTAHRMRTLVVGLVRSYRDLCELQQQKVEMQNLVKERDATDVLLHRYLQEIDQQSDTNIRIISDFTKIKLGKTILDIATLVQQTLKTETVLNLQTEDVSVPIKIVTPLCYILAKLMISMLTQVRSNGESSPVCMRILQTGAEDIWIYLEGPLPDTNDHDGHVIQALLRHIGATDVLINPDCRKIEISCVR